MCPITCIRSAKRYLNGQDDMSSSDLDREIGKLDEDVQSALSGGVRWKDVWDRIRAISAKFKDVRYPTRGGRTAAWERFQTIVQVVRADQNEAEKRREKLGSKSRDHLDRIRGYANEAERDDYAVEELLRIFSVGLYDLLRAGMDALFGKLDMWHEDLKRRSAQLKLGWTYLSEHKAEMVGADKGMAHSLL